MNININDDMHTKKFQFENSFFSEPKVFQDVRLYQIGDLCCKSSCHYETHIQNCYEISYIVSGKGHYFNNNKSYLVKEGDVFLNLPSDAHGWEADSIDPFRFFYMGFDFNSQNIFKYIQELFNEIECPVSKDMFDIQNAFLGAFRSILNSNNYSNTLIMTYLYQIIILTYHNFFKDQENDYMEGINIESEVRYIVYKAINYIDNNLFQIQELGDIAKGLGYSYSYLSRIFSRETGTTIQEYYSQKRFQKAIELIKKENLSITRIAEKLNYQSIHSFSKAFTKNVGMSPQEYKFMVKNNKYSEEQ